MGGDAVHQGEHWVERLPLAQSRPWLALGITAAIVATAFVLRLMMMGSTPDGLAFVTFFPAVLLTCFLLGARMGMVAALASILLACVFFLSDPLHPGPVLNGAPAVLLFALLVSLNLTLFHWMQRANAKLRVERTRSDSLAEIREILFRELQHRVSNNLQVAAGLLALQKKHVGDGAARAALDETARRLSVIGRISRQLYQSTGGTRGMRAFLEPLCADVVEMSGRAGVTISVRAEEDMQLAPDAALPLALIVAEAIANAIEHGFADRAEGTIEVVLGRDGTGAGTVEVRDNGSGLPAGFDLARSNSLGLGIARTFAEQLGGRFELVEGDGTVARVVLAG